MSTKRTRKFEKITIDDVKEILDEIGVEYLTDARTQSSYVSSEKCDIVLKGRRSIGIKRDGDGIEVTGDFYHCKDIFGRNINNHVTADDFMNSLEAAHKQRKYKKALAQAGAQFLECDMKPQNGELVIKARLQV